MSSGGIIFVAAGSGGHIYAALATYKAFEEKYPTLSTNNFFVGSTLLMEDEKSGGSIEERICAHHNIPFQKIRMGKLQRRLSLALFKNLFLSILGFFDAYRLLKKTKPSVIVAFGGYVALPMVIVGKMLKIKTVIHEQTSSIGLTNNILQKFADEIAVSYKSSLEYIKKGGYVIGSPTMPYIYSISDYSHLFRYMEREKSSLLKDITYLARLRKLGEKKTRPVLLFSGGSQGSHFLNQKLSKILPDLLKEWTVILQVGENQWYDDYSSISEYVKSLPADLSKHCIVRKFLFEEFGYVMKHSDLFIGRSGANTVYQVGMNRLRAVFIPISWVTKNEQYTNALILKEAGVAEIINQEQCSSKKLLEVISGVKSKLSEPYAEEVSFTTTAAQDLAKRIATLAV